MRLASARRPHLIQCEGAGDWTFDTNRSSMSYVLALLFAVSFLPQGLFYRHEFLPAVALLGAWLLARAWRNHEKVSLRLYGGPALLLIGYLLSLLDALRPTDTWMAVAQIAVLFGLLMSASTERDPRTVLRGIAAAALIGAVYALLVRGGFWHDPAAYTPPFLTGSIQYHNAFGAAMALGLMVLYALAGDEKSEWWRSAYAAVGVPLALALYLSLSRGVYVLFPLAFILLFGVLDPLGRRRVAAVGLVGLVLGLVLIGPVSQAADHRSMAMFLWLLAAMALAYVAALGLNRLPHLLFGRRAMQAYLGIIVVLVAFGGLLARSKVLHLLARLAPAGVGSRVGAISIHSATLFDRLIMDGMALRHANLKFRRGPLHRGLHADRHHRRHERGHLRPARGELGYGKRHRRDLEREFQQRLHFGGGRHLRHRGELERQPRHGDLCRPPERRERDGGRKDAQN